MLTHFSVEGEACWGLGRRCCASASAGGSQLPSRLPPDGGPWAGRQSFLAREACRTLVVRTLFRLQIREPQLKLTQEEGMN